MGTVGSEETSCIRQLCGCPENLRAERLEYNYDHDDANKRKQQPLPRIRQRGEYHIDSFNGETYSCSFGTSEESGIWTNSGDQAGTVMATLVWILMIYSAITVTSLTVTEGIPPILGMVYDILVALALSSHAKTSLTDPGSVPKSAVPVESQRRDSTSHSMCGQCQTFKPPMSHHCRICNRCVSRMDHHCPWMNNCVGEYETFHTIFGVYMVGICSCTSHFWLELLSLCRGRLCSHARFDSIGSCLNGLSVFHPPFYIFHDNECYVWNDDWCGNY